jgi:hypothetical protein
MQTTTQEMDDAVKEMSDIIDKPSLVGLAYSLRHPETWPKGFTWHYNDCRRCAMGLAATLWQLDQPKPQPGTNQTHHYSWAAREFAIPLGDAMTLFKKVRPPFALRHPFARRDIGDVLPEHVADAIDRYLRDGE